MKKKLFLIAITVITIGSSCTNADEQNKQEIQSEKHDSTHKKGNRYYGHENGRQ